MGDFSKIFYNSEPNTNTLHDRITLSSDQISHAREKKDELLKYLKTNLSASLEVDVKHWLQGSYKNHTLIRPTKKGAEFDIDVGIYLYCNAPDEGIDAGYAKSLCRQILGWYAEEYSVTLADSKARCERIIFPKYFHLDIPLYYFDVNTGVCRLATDQGWIDSDPEALQKWFDATVSDLSKSSLGRLRRVIRYIKTWSCLSIDKGIFKSFPSIAITVLVAELFVDSIDDDDAFIETIKNITSYFNKNRNVPSPINSDDLLNLEYEDFSNLKQSFEVLNGICQRIYPGADIFESYMLWSEVFDFNFPAINQLNAAEKEIEDLPATTIPPVILIKQYDSKDNYISESNNEQITAYKDESLNFIVKNHASYPIGSKVKWLVRNNGTQAENINDLGHFVIMELNEYCPEHCGYHGLHIMECIVIHNRAIVGYGSVRVNIHGHARPLKNPKRKFIFKGYN